MLIIPERRLSSPELGGVPHDDVCDQPEAEDHARKNCDILPDIHIRKPIHTWHVCRLWHIRAADADAGDFEALVHRL